MRPAYAAARDGQNGRIRPPYPSAIVPLLPAFLQRRRVGFTAPLRIVDELGIDRPTLVFVVNALALHDEEGARFADLFNPYPTRFDQWSGPAAAARGAGLAEDVGDRWRVTPAGRALAARVRREADAYLAGLTLIDADELRELARVLRGAFDAIAASTVPKDHILRTRSAFGDDRIPLVALENAVYGLWQARDDCHMSSWREAGFSGPVFDVFTRIWRGEASDEAALERLVAQQAPADVREALARLRADGLVRADALTVTERGGAERRSIEEETDRRFFEPWPDDVGARGEWIRSRLAQVNDALERIAAPA